MEVWENKNAVGHRVKHEPLARFQQLFRVLPDFDFTSDILGWNTEKMFRISFTKTTLQEKESKIILLFA